ncbi:MAG TPA: glycosyltransferase, partial [Elusimicrobiota bacterium]|nr:glycosyltransferase [Elusimicrobiota bacterium]
LVNDAYLGDFPQPLPHDGLVVGSCGRATYARNPDAWVLLAQRLTDSRNNVRCVWIGGGELEPIVREMARDMNLLAGKLEITGWLPREEALKRLRAADVCVHFSRWEGLPNAVLDAMACSLPVAVSDIPGNRDLVRPETGVLASTEVELLEKVLELIDAPERRRALGAAARETVVREYSQERMLRELSELYSR